METFKTINRQGGFTLIEILIAISILTFMMVSVYQITSESIDTKEMVSVEDREFLQVERALERLNLDFTEIYSPLYYSHRYRSQDQRNQFDNRSGARSGQGQSGGARAPRYETSDKYPMVTHHGRAVPKFESPAPHSFIFMSASHRRKFMDSKESNYSWVRYSLGPMLQDSENEQRREGGQRLIRQVQARNVYSRNHNWGEVEEQTLLNDVKSFSIEYWNPSTQNWVSDIERLNENQYRLSMIRIFLEWIDPNGFEQEFTRIYRHHWTSYDPAIDEAAYREANRPRGQRGEDHDEDQGGHF